jgi:two-component system response regulator DevR
MRVMVVDDHDVVREGLRALLTRQEGVTVVAEAKDGEEACREAVRTRPDVIVMDIRMPGISGVEACRQIRERQPDVKVLMLTSYADDQAVIASIMAGASGFVLKQTRSNVLIEALHTVAAGGSLLDPAVTTTVLERMRKGAEEDELVEALNDQERKILALIAEGKTNKQIASEIYLSDKTVKNYVSSILGKLGMERRAEAAAFAARREAERPGSG